MNNDLQKALTGGSSKPRATALSGFTPPPVPQKQDQAAQQPQQPPAPSHNQTVAALRHFNAILQQLNGLVKNPDLGRTDMKDTVIEGVTKLVADRMMSPGDAVTTLATFPERPFDQRAWVQNHISTTLQAEQAVLIHHGTAFAGQPQQPTPDPDNHIADMSSMMQSHYGQNAGS